MYEELFTQIKKEPDTRVTIDLSNLELANPAALLDKIMNLDSLSDNELFDIIKNYYNIILDDIFKNKTAALVDLFLNPRFIQVSTQAFYSVQLTDTQKCRVNKMVYDYLVLNREKDSYIQTLLMSLSKTINRDKIPLLCAKKIPEDLASLLALSRYSSEKDTINVKRLNRIIMMQSQDLMTEQMVIDIYLTLFDHVTPLFEGIMLDVISPYGMTPAQSEIYATITLAMFDIIHELPSADLYQLFKSFATDKQLLYPDNSVRVNLESCSVNDYPKIIRVIDILKQEGIYLY